MNQRVWDAWFEQAKLSAEDDSVLAAGRTQFPQVNSKDHY